MSNDRREQRPVDGPFQGEELLARLYQQTKEEEPPSHLDTAILAAAHRAAQPSSRRVRFLPARKWAIPLSLAAAFWVTIEIVAMHLNEPRVGMKLKMPQSVSPPATPAERVSPEFGQKELPPASGVSREKSEALKQAAPLTAAAPSVSATRPDAQPLVTPAMLGARLEEDKGDTPVETETPLQLKKGRSISATSASGNAPVAVEQKSQGRIDALRDEIPSPEAWIVKINELRRAGKLTEAEKSLKKFKAQYPEYPVEKFLK